MKLKNKNGLNIYGFNVKSDNFPGPGPAELLFSGIYGLSGRLRLSARF